MTAVCTRTRIPEQYSTCSGIPSRSVMHSAAAQLCSARIASRASYERKRGKKAVFHLFIRIQTKGLSTNLSSSLRTIARKKQVEKRNRWAYPKWGISDVQNCSVAGAGYLAHLFTKSEDYASTMALISHLAFTKRCTCEETQEQASSCSMNIHAPTHQPSREVTYSLRLWKETQKHPLTLTRPFCSAERASSVLCKRTCQGLCCSLIVVV